MVLAAPEYPQTPASIRGEGNNPDTPVVETAVEARQGVTGHGVRYVLFFSLGLVVIAFAVIAVFLR